MYLVLFVSQANTASTSVLFSNLTLCFCLVKGSWKWLDKTVLDYTNWAEDELENEFAEVSTADGLWKTGRRWHDRAYICETPRGETIKFRFR